MTGYIFQFLPDGAGVTAADRKFFRCIPQAYAVIAVFPLFQELDVIEGHQGVAVYA